MKTNAFLFILFIYSFSPLYASHIQGGDVSYKHLGGLKYEVSFRFYRDCRGIPMDTIHAEMKSSSTVKSLSLTKISIKDVSVYCKKSSNPCNKPNTTVSNQGIEEHLFRDTVDFNKADSAFKKLCKIQFGFGQCCRNGGLVIGSGGDFWVWSTLDFCAAPNNSSPRITSIPNNFICCNQPLYYCIGASDTIDGDSISYSIIEPYESWTKKIPFPTPPREWISTYKPSGYKGGPNPNANPPIGTYFDPETGDMILTPVDCNEFPLVAFRMAEWRKDSSGSYKLIGETRRDIQYTVQTCPSNNVPLLYGPYKFEICSGDKLCFNINADDKVYVPPPPGKTAPPDSVILKWNRGIIHGASFKIIDTTVRVQRGQFCWTPKDSLARDMPYYFTVMAKDNNCANSAVTIKSYSVRVKKRAKATFVKTFISNGLFKIELIPEKGFKGTPQYFMEFVDSAFKSIDTAYYFHSNLGSKSNKALDSVQFYKAGKYILHYRINNPPYNCPTDYFDTFKVAKVTPILRISPISLQHVWSCQNKKDTLRPILKNARKPVRFIWNSSSTDTLPYLIIENKRDSLYRVDVYDSARYHRFAEWNVQVYQVPKLIEKKDIMICTADTVSLSGQSEYFADTIHWNWEFNGNPFSKKQTVKVNKLGTYTLQISDSSGCKSQRDTINVKAMIVLVKSGLKAMSCVGDSATLFDTTFKLGGKKYWKWYFEGKQVSAKPILRAAKTGKYILDLLDSNQCFTQQDTIEFSHRIVKAKAGMVKRACIGDSMKLYAASDTSMGWKSKYYWHLNTLSQNPMDSGSLILYRFKKDSTVIIRLIQSNGSLKCDDLDTLRVAFRPLPPIELGQTSLCQNEVEQNLHALILKPLNSDRGIAAWTLLSTLKKPNGLDNTLNDLVYDKDTSLNDKYFLRVGESLIDLKGKFRDSIKLGLTYKDEFGCVNYSSKAATITIRSNIEIKFINPYLSRCYGDSLKYLSNDYGVNYYGGNWYTFNDSSSYLKWPQGNNAKLLEKISTQNLDSKGGSYVLKYVLENNNCFSYKHAILNLFSFPVIKWSQSYRGDSIVLKDISANATRREWFVNSKKMSSADTIVLSKAEVKIKKIVLKLFNASCETDSVIVPKIVDKISHIHTAGFVISPNPVRGELQIKTVLSQTYKCEIVNSLGQVVMVRLLKSKEETIDVSALTNGIYNLMLKSEHDLMTQKFIKVSN